MPDTSRRDETRRNPSQDESVCSQKPDSLMLVRLFEEWMHGDEAEQRETFEILRRSLDEDRLEGYKLFS